MFNQLITNIVFFRGFNLDFISFGLENDLYFQKFDNFVKENKDIVDSYSIYTLELFPWSIWYQKIENIDEKILDNFEKYLDIIGKYDYQRYEISNFAKKWKESLHNQVYWEMKNYLWIGTSASWFVGDLTNLTDFTDLTNSEKEFFKKNINLSSKNTIHSSLFTNHLQSIRYTNSYWIQDYLKWVFKLKEEKILTEKELLEEKVFLWLRTNKWVFLDENIKKIINFEKLKEYEKEKYLVLQDNKIVLTNKWFNIYNYLITDIINLGI